MPGGRVMAFRTHWKALRILSLPASVVVEASTSPISYGFSIARASVGLTRCSNSDLHASTMTGAWSSPRASA